MKSILLGVFAVLLAGGFFIGQVAADVAAVPVSSTPAPVAAISGPG